MWLIITEVLIGLDKSFEALVLHSVGKMQVPRPPIQFACSLALLMHPCTPSPGLTLCIMIDIGFAASLAFWHVQLVSDLSRGEYPTMYATSLLLFSCQKSYRQNPHSGCARQPITTREETGNKKQETKVYCCNRSNNLQRIYASVFRMLSSYVARISLEDIISVAL